MAGAFSDALDQLEKCVAADPFDGWACREAFYDVSKAFAPGIKADDLRRMVGNCLHVMGLASDPAPVVESADIKGSLGWAVETCLEVLLIDKGGQNRDYIQSGVNRQLALGVIRYEGAPSSPVPLPNIPLEPEEARMLITPYLDHLEAETDKNPLAHIKLCWDVFEFPAPPFDTVFDAWLAELDQKRDTNDLNAIRRAMALEVLAEEGRQRLSWPDCEKQLLPQLEDPHPLIAAAAGRYLGMLYSEADEMFVFSTPQPLRDMLERLAALPINRRVVAGGFLHGFDAGMDGPFNELRKQTTLQDFDVDGWTLDILAQGGVEPYLPSAQAFWFHVHEGYCFDPAFVERMIDAGHHWEAMMTATEMHQRVEGMEPVLKRLTAMEVSEVSDQAQRWLDLYYANPD